MGLGELKFGALRHPPAMPVQDPKIEGRRRGGFNGQWELAQNVPQRSTANCNNNTMLF